MKISTFWYCLKEGFRNIRRNILFSLASTATISACIFLFCFFFSLIMNIRHVVAEVEADVGITVFFQETLNQAEVEAMGVEIHNRPEVRIMRFISAEDAWNHVKAEYFEGREDLAEGFAQDNPLAGSASYEIFLNNIKDQEVFVQYLKSLPQVRKVNYSSIAVSGLSSFNQMIGLLSMVIIGILLAVALFLISNTILVAAAFRKQENQIMKLIGATDFMIRAPFVIEGMLIGLVGALLPLAAICGLYESAVRYVMEKFPLLSRLAFFLPIGQIFPVMAMTAITLGMGIGFCASHLTIQRQLKR